MGKLNYFNYCALAVLLILSVIVLFRGLLSARRNRLFWYVLLVAVGSVVFDIWAVALDNSLSTNIAMRHISHSGYLILHNFSTPMFILYLIELTDTWHKLRRSRIQTVLFAVPFLSVLVCTLLNPLTGTIFYLDENYAYVRGPWFGLLYVSAVFYLVYGLVYLMHYRKLFERMQFISLLVMFVLIPASVAIQFFNPVVPIEMFTQTLGILFILLVIQRPEERLDPVTGFEKGNAYIADMTKAFSNEKSMHIILMQLTNYRSLYDMLGFEDINGVLKTAAERVREACADCSCRAEFYYLDRGQFGLVLRPESGEGTEKLAEALCIAMERSFQMHHMDIDVQAKCCVIRCPGDISDVQTLLSFVRKYEWKDDRRVICAADVVSRDHYDLLHQIDAIIEKAIVNKAFSVYYQPIYSVKEGRFNSAEALLRLKDEKYGFISPEIFIPAAEKSGAIHRIGAYVLEEVCRFISEDRFRELGVDYIEVNLSAAQCMRSDLAQEVMQILDKYKVSTSQINLEITETAASYAQTIMMDNINALAGAGIAISLDDFGTGYSNMQRVALLPLHIVKLDKTFANLEENPKLEIVVRNTIRMIKDMNLQIVVEGIESAGLARQFSELDCEYIQGYYYSKPLPKEEYVKFMMRQCMA